MPNKILVTCYLYLLLVIFEGGLFVYSKDSEGLLAAYILPNLGLTAQFDLHFVSLGIKVTFVILGPD